MPERLDPTSDRPAYRQIADRLRGAILRGELPPGEQLPSERALMEQYEAARGTVRQAIALLRSEGHINIEHGRGVFVRPRPPIRRLSHDRFARRHREAGKAAFLAEAETEGFAAQVEVLDVRVDSPPPEVAERLKLGADEETLVRERRYLADTQPVEHAISWLPYEFVRGTAIEESNPGPGGIYARLEEQGHKLEYFTEEVSARMPVPEEVRTLALEQGVPILRLLRTAYALGDQPVEVCETLMAADRFVLSYQLPAD